jgi:hypothetical protein
MALDIFVDQALRGIDSYKTEFANAHEMFDRLRDRQGSSRTVDADQSRIDLTERQLFLVTAAIAFYSSFFGSHPQMLLEMSLIYAGALFDAVVSDALMAVLRHIPERMRSSRTLTAAEALRFNSRDELIEDLARRELLDVMYKSVDKQFEYFRVSFGVDVFSDECLAFSIVDLSAVRERRNLIAHNGGLATSGYAERIDPEVAVGERVVSDVQRAKADRKVLSTVALALLSRLRDELAPT